MSINVTKKRLLSLDVFRGITIAGMILVNTPGSWSHVYPPLLHASWHGLTPTDLVFPFFLFIVGISMFFSFAKYNYKLSRRGIKKIGGRVLGIFLIGLGLNALHLITDFSRDLRVMGVLQRIALAYFVGSLLCLSFSIKNIWKVGMFILLIYWILLYLLGGNNPYALETNFSRTLDVAILGEKALYHGFGIPFDPEGFFGTFSAAVTVMIGYWTGAKIKELKDRTRLVKELLLKGSILIFFALIWNMFFPINKALWTSSYVLCSAGIGMIVLGILMEYIDVQKRKSWTKPFIVFGINPLIIYVFSGIFSIFLYDFVQWETVRGKSMSLYDWIYTEIFVSWLPHVPQFASLLFALFSVFVCWLFGWGLYRKNIFIKL